VNAIATQFENEQSAGRMTPMRLAIRGTRWIETNLLPVGEWNRR
jgi:hypothetical protein